LRNVCCLKQRSNAARIERYARARAAAAAVPGVGGVALSVLTPFSGFQWSTVIDNPPGMSLAEDQREVDLNFVSPGWFDAVGTRRVSGRDIAPGSTAPGPEDVVVNEAFARKLLPGRNPVGAVVHEVVGPGRVSSDLTIVGVVQDALYDSIRDAAPPTMYRPLERVDQAATSMVLNVRMPDQPSPTMVADLSRAIGSAAPSSRLSFGRCPNR
jgi:hypothetical protein